MKKQTSPKHRYLLLGVVATMLLLIGSCKKELIQYNSPINFQPLEGAKLNSLKKMYAQDQNIVFNNDNWLNTFSPNWSKVNEQKLEKGSVYEIMLNNPQGVFATDGMVDLKGAKKKYANKSSIRLLIFQDEHGQNHRACFMEIIATGESELPTQLSYMNYGNLNGLVSFYELDGKLANGWVYSNGRVVMSTAVNGMQTNALSGTAKSGGNGRIMFQDGPPEGHIDCGSRLVPKIRTVCGEVGGLEGPGYDGGEGSGKECYDQMYFVSERIYCPIKGGDGDYKPQPNPTPPPNGGGSFNPEDPRDKYELIVIADSLKLSKRIECFNVVPNNTNTTYSAIIYTELANSNNPAALLSLTYKPGHTFISITKTNGAITVTETFGFYPENAKKAAYQLSTTSMIVDNENHAYNASLEITINANQFTAMLQTAIAKSQNKYDMTGYNCTNFALDVFSQGASNTFSVPDSRAQFSNINYGKTPSGVYETIKAMKTAGAPGARVTSGSGKASTKCN